MSSSIQVTRPIPLRIFAVFAICAACVIGPMPARAEDTSDSAAPSAAKPSTPSAMVSLINRLAARGLLTKQDAEDLTSMAEADAADARVEAAEARLAAAKAEAAAARARAALARANEELALARANAAQLAANQNAAVRLLLGQGQGAAAAPASPVSEAASPAAAENTAVTAAGSETVAAPVQPAPGAPGAREVAEATEAAAAAAAAAPGAQSSPAPASAAEAPAVQDAAASTDSAQTPAVEAQSSPAPTSAAEAPAASTAVNLTRNEEGAIVVPEETEGGQSNATVVQSDSTDSSAPAPEDSAKPEAANSGDQATSALGASAPTDAPAADTAATSPDNTNASTENASTAVVPRDDSAQAPEMTESSDRSGPAVTAAEAPAANSAAVPAIENTGSSDDVVRVAYVPEVVKNQIREEVKNEVIAEARKENWGSPSSGPEWVSRFTLYGDIRVRAEELINHGGNDDTGAFPDFNAINTGAPFDTAGNVFSPQYNVDQNRNRERLRARLGFAVVLSGGFTAGLRIATGNDNNPVTENQTFGAAGNAQGGDFSKYSLWLDRAFIKYESPGSQGPPFWMTFGRFDNPFFSTTLIWANDLGFDGFAISIPVKANLKGRPAGDFKPFLVGGAFPIFNTDLNYATNSPTKFQSYDKWLYAGQLGFDAKISDDFQLKAAAALYEYKNIQGQLSSPFTPLTTSDAGDTDASRPSFAQNGNTYMALRDIIPGPTNDNGTIDQFQYYGLATPFKEFAVTEGLYYNHFEPFQISLVSEWVRNLAFNEASVAAVAVNNGGSSNFIGGNTGWMTTLKFGSSIIQDLGDWSASIGYRRVESDAVVDGFNDADFGGVLTGTNLKGFTLAASFGLSRDVWIDAHWYSASAIAGPIYRNDLLQLDLNAKF
jgi:putative porin